MQRIHVEKFNLKRNISIELEIGHNINYSDLCTSHECHVNEPKSKRKGNWMVPLYDYDQHGWNRENHTKKDHPVIETVESSRFKRIDCTKKNESKESKKDFDT